MNVAVSNTRQLHESITIQIGLKINAIAAWRYIFVDMLVWECFWQRCGNSAPILNINTRTDIDSERVSLICFDIETTDSTSYAEICQILCVGPDNRTYDRKWEYCLYACVSLIRTCNITAMFAIFPYPMTILYDTNFTI